MPLAITRNLSIRHRHGRITKFYHREKCGAGITLHLVRVSVWAPETSNSQSAQLPQTQLTEEKNTFPKDGSFIQRATQEPGASEDAYHRQHEKPALDHTPDCRKTAFPSVHYDGGVGDALSPAGLFVKAGYIGGWAY